MTDNTVSLGNWSTEKATRVMLGIIAVSTVLFGWLSYLQYAHLNALTHETLHVSYAMAHTKWGHFLPSHFVEGGSYWGSHITIQWVLLLPLFKLIPTVPFLLFAQSFFISASAWPLYLLAKHKLQDNFAAVTVGVAYLFFPPIVSQHLNQLHDDQFANVWLILAAYLFVREQFRWFWLPALLTCLSKEYFGLTVAMFGVWALIEKRTWKWILTPLVIGFGWFWLAIKVIIPLIPGTGAGAYSSWMFLEQYGSSQSEIINNMLNHPGRVIAHTFSARKLWYLATYFGPVLWLLPFLGGAAVLILPNLTMNLVGTDAFSVLQWHYGFLVGAATFISVIYGLLRARRWLTPWFGNVSLRVLASLLAVGSFLSYPLWLDINTFSRPSNYAALREGASFIPREASVVCTGPLLAHFAHHPKVTSCSELLSRHKLGALSTFVLNAPETRAVWREGVTALADYDFVILDANWRNPSALAQQPAFEWLQKTNVFQLVFNQQGVLVFKRAEQGK